MCPPTPILWISFWKVSLISISNLGNQVNEDNNLVINRRKSSLFPSQNCQHPKWLDLSDPAGSFHLLSDGPAEGNEFFIENFPFLWSFFHYLQVWRHISKLGSRRINPWGNLRRREIQFLRIFCHQIFLQKWTSLLPQWHCPNQPLSFPENNKIFWKGFSHSLEILVLLQPTKFNLKDGKEFVRGNLICSREALAKMDFGHNQVEKGKFVGHRHSRGIPSRKSWSGFSLCKRFASPNVVVQSKIMAWFC